MITVSTVRTLVIYFYWIKYPSLLHLLFKELINSEKEKTATDGKGGKDAPKLVKWLSLHPSGSNSQILVCFKWQMLLAEDPSFLPSAEHD